MSKQNNVNPDHYKLAGRDRSGDAVAKPPKATAAQEEARFRKRQALSERRASGGRPTR